MVTILLEQIIEILKGWLSSFTSWAEGVATTLGLIEEQTEYIDDIYDDTEAIKDNTTSIADSNTMIQGYSLIISNKATTIDSNVTAIKNNVGSIATSSGVAAAFAEDCATNGLNILDKVTTIASDTTQLRADNTVVKSDLNKIYDALKWSLVGIDTTETVENIDSVSFDTDKTDLLNQFVIAFDPVQIGTGDPSPSNPIAISGWTDFDITANSSILNIDLDGTYYCGSVDCITGKITSTHGYIVLDGSSDENWQIYGSQNGFYINLTNMKPGTNQSGMCNCFEIGKPFTAMGLRLGANNTLGYFNHITDSIAGVTDMATWRAWLANNPVTVVYPLATPIEAQASNVLSINTQKGLNTITCDSNGTMTVTYTESVKHYLDKQEG